MCGILAVLGGVQIESDEHAEAQREIEAEGEAWSESDLLRQAQWWLEKRGPDGQKVEKIEIDLETAGTGHDQRPSLLLSSSLLQTRGRRRLSAPTMKDDKGNVLAFNGEIYGGLGGALARGGNDGEALLEELGKASATGQSVDAVLSRLRGPWAVIYYQAETQTLWFGRDVIGRRSLLQCTSLGASSGNPYFVISSVFTFLREADDVSAAMSAETSPSNERNSLWKEIPPGIYSLSLSTPGAGNQTSPDYNHDIHHHSIRINRHDWKDPVPAALAARAASQSEAQAFEPSFCAANGDANAGSMASSGGKSECEIHAEAEALLALLRESVSKRCTFVNQRHRQGESSSDIPPASIAIMYSGGLDSAILAALAGEALQNREPIDLINVCFANGKSPDRVAALEGLLELSEAYPEREWRMIEVNSNLEEVDAMREELMHLLFPSNTFMDLNIGAALSIGASCRGALVSFGSFVKKGEKEDGGGGRGEVIAEDYSSAARVIIMGHGADEQCGGYGRHRTKFRDGGWPALAKEIELDVNRLWSRNLGRDDRCISNQGREARFPLLDEDVALALHRMPIQIKVDPAKPMGIGDKQILRIIAKEFLGLKMASQRAKRAIQFGSRIAKLSNVRDFGSNRQANKANAGTVRIFDKIV